jgi:hypothetical protein
MRAITRRSWSLTVFLADGLPDGRRTVDKVRWNVHAIVCPRPRFLEVRSSDEFARPGVYVLSSPYEEGAKPRIYIGKSHQLRHRLKRHYKKEFWTKLIVFTSRSESFTTTHADYLESQLISLAKKVRRCYMAQNNQHPPPLPTADEAAMVVFLKDMLHICARLGLTAFEGPAWPDDDPPSPKKLRG